MEAQDYFGWAETILVGSDSFLRVGTILLRSGPFWEDCDGAGIFWVGGRPTTASAARYL